MAVASDRKRRTREHIIADLGVNHVERLILLCGWTGQRMHADYGIDLVMNTFDMRGRIENGVVKFQVKATDTPRIVAGRRGIAVRLDWRDVLYWLNEWMPVILVVYDAKRDRAWWLFLQEALRDAARGPWRPASRVTVHVPVTNRLTIPAMRRFASYRDAALAEG
jgi:hypothetical protein